MATENVERLLEHILLLPDDEQLDLLKELLELHAEDLGLYTSERDTAPNR